MKKIVIHIFVLCVFSGPFAAKSQDMNLSSNIRIPTLQELIDTAIVRSPLLKAQSLVIEGINEEIKVERKKWLDHIYIDGIVNYGIYDNLIINRLSDGIDDPSQGILTKNEQLRYYGGISLKMPISTISSSSNSVKAKRLRQEQARYEMQQIKEDIKQIIIEEYFQLLYMQESMNTYNNINQTLEISVLKAEKDLINGQMEFDEYGILVSTAGKSKDEYLKARNNFYAQYNKLQSLSGIKFTQND